MKKTRIALFCLLIVTAGLLLCDVMHPVPPSEKRRAMLQLTVSAIEANHFDPVPVNDSLSARIFTLYLKRLNRNKMYFTQEDIDKLEPYKYKLDTAIEQGTFEFYDLANKIFDKRMAEDSVYVKQALSKPFDFTTNEDIQLNPDKIPYPKNDKELREQWRKLLKYDVLYNLDGMMTKYERAKAKHDTAVKKDTAFKVKTFEQMESDARKEVLKSYEGSFKEYRELNDTDKISEFCGDIANCFDPHTEYFAPAEGKNFAIGMSGQLEGIGAQLKEKDGNIMIDRVVPGSPAWKSGELNEGDIFQKVAQGSAEPVDIEGMRLDQAVQLIRGKKGTEVRLTVKKANNTIKVVTLIRDVIHLDETFAHAAIIDNGEKMGYIRLPEFYTDMEGRGGRRCSDDVKELVKELEAENVKGIIIDLRSDGGGSLQEVVKMAGLFVPRGPMVMVKARNHAPELLDSRDTGVLYRGPLIVLVDGESASASEIFAAAMQDYKRAVIMGSQTYGKGTVQQIFPLDENSSSALNNLKPLGQVKITISKFYRISGGSTQRDGVTPDIIIPDPAQYDYEKEKDGEYPLNYDKISPCDYQVWNNAPDFEYLRNRSAERIAKDSVFSLMNQEALYYKRLRDNTTLSLNLTQYRKEEKERTDSIKRFEPISKPLPFAKVQGIYLSNDTTNKTKTKPGDYDNLIAMGSYSGAVGNSEKYSYSMNITPTIAEKAKMKSDTNEVKTENTWLKRLTRDPELFEATRTINDMK